MSELCIRMGQMSMAQSHAPDMKIYEVFVMSQEHGMNCAEHTCSCL